MDFSWLSSWKEKKALLTLAANGKANVFTISRFTTDGTMKASPSLCYPSKSLLWCSHLWVLLQTGSYLQPYHHVPHSLVGTPHPCLSCGACSKLQDKVGDPAVIRPVPRGWHPVVTQAEAQSLVPTAPGPRLSYMAEERQLLQVAVTVVLGGREHPATDSRREN